MTIKYFFSLFLPIALSTLVSCKGGNAFVSADGGDTLHLKYADHLSLVKYPDYVKATVRNPWDTTAVLHTYVLVPDSVSVPEGLPEEWTVVRTPLKSALIYSSVHNSLVTELGALDAISGVCDAQYIHQKSLVDRIAGGSVADCGTGTSPNIEKIISLNPDGVMLSPYENSGTYGRLGQLGIPLIECADYMETSPLARAEWMILYGMLFDLEEEARRLFDATEREYNALKNLTEGVADRPKVLVDRLYGQAWYVPAANSTMGIFIKDAGGDNPFAVHDRNGSVGLAGEQVLYQAEDADVWLMRYAQDSDKTMRDLASDNAIYTQFKAFKDNRVYGCNTSRVFFYEDIPFHPQWLLRDMISILHPGLVAQKDGKKYFTQLEQ